MPVDKAINRPWDFGDDCLFAVCDWLGFTGVAAKEYATVTGTLSEVKTPYGTGLQCAAGNSYVQFNWRARCPEGATPRTIFTYAYFSSAPGNYATASFGGAAIRDYTFVGPATTQYWGGLNGDYDADGSGCAAGWQSYALTNAGINGGANIVYGQGVQQVAGTNGAVAVGTYGDLYLMSLRGAVNCPVGSIIQVALMFKRVLAAGEILALHNWCVGLRA